MRPVVLVILDGYGVGPAGKGNAIALANKPNLDFIEKNFPSVLLQASGVPVGLPWGEPGNSEVGHTAMGTGQIWQQPLTRITLAIQNGTFFQNAVLKKAASHAKENNSRWHLVGLVGSGSVHSYLDHLYALVEMAKNENIKEVWLHLAADGQDSPPKEAATLIQNLIERLNWAGAGKIATIIGRFYSMDRDGHWDRIEKAYRLMVNGEGEKTQDFVSTIKNQYAKNVNDNYLEPMVLVDPVRSHARDRVASPEDRGAATSNGVDDKNGAPGLIKDNDAVIFFNIREDRARQLTRALAQPDFKEFARPALKNIFFASLIAYETSRPVAVVFPPLELKYTLSQIISQSGKKQFKIAETEKYAHVTYFFNGGRETTFPGEERQLIKSAAVAHFNEAPQMKSGEVADGLITALKNGTYDFLLANLANADMVGHTGDLSATTKGIEAVDTAVGKIMNAVLEKDGALIITADHGNAEEKLNSLTGEISTEHTANPVPFYLVTNQVKRERSINKSNEVSGILQDVAATVLDLLGLAAPGDMDSKSLLPMLYKQ